MKKEKAIEIGYKTQTQRSRCEGCQFFSVEEKIIFYIRKNFYSCSLHEEDVGCNSVCMYFKAK